MQIKASYKNDEERHNATHHKKPKYHDGREKHLKRLGDGWTDNGLGATNAREVGREQRGNLRGGCMSKLCVEWSVCNCII